MITDYRVATVNAGRRLRHTNRWSPQTGLRVGDWRLIYKLVHRVFHFITLGHRSEVYQ